MKVSKITVNGSTLSTGNTLAIQSGGDTTLKGATGKAERIIASVGGNLLLDHRQVYLRNWLLKRRRRLTISLKKPLSILMELKSEKGSS
ncbi:hemagglutinin repeat-containing protein [Achromobacter deleyi]|uniref:hemagglutinin repeat-containing protein n=1 Tax=Achromobacter deleyi TaxID=1353891 RepID=UPI00149273EA|nr:hemagglutinin repeat-containing protein [Achromobacter deleyi]